MDTEDNLFAPPKVEVAPNRSVLSLAEAEKTRKEFLTHEGSVRSIGSLFYLISLVMILVMAVGISVGSSHSLNTFETAIALLVIVLSLLFVFLGFRLQNLDERAKVPVACLSVIGLLVVPIGTLLGLYILYFVLCDKGKVVFSEEYQEVIRLTPHLQTRGPSLVFGFCFVLVVLMVAAVFFLGGV